MKVIGKTASGFLVEASEIELANICGVSYPTSAPWGSRNTRDGVLPIGTVIPVSDIYQHLGALERSEAAVKSGAAAMRALADLAERSIPTAVLPPAPPEPPAGGGL